MVIGGHEGEALAELTGGTPFRFDLHDRDALSDAELARLLLGSDCARKVRHMRVSRGRWWSLAWLHGRLAVTHPF